ncbi:MAG: NADH-quinone oxidoreductase subunit C [Myxococcales bacterium]|nr:MAG: NADH-quinone oxidoreductase subunit C [Myxococcales bacterium]
MLDKVASILNQKAPGAVLEAIAVPEDDRLRIGRAHIRKVCEILKSDPELDFKMLTDLTAVDYLGQDERFEVVYQLYSLSKNYRLRLKVRVPENEPLDSVSAVWRVANPFEREIFDMFGVRFAGHPNLKRILMYDEFEGHPLRKDYPLKKCHPIVPLRWPIEPKDDPPYNWTTWQARRKLRLDD